MNYDSISNICNFDNIDIDKIDLSKLHCIYLSSQCKNKKLNRLEERKKRLEENKEDMDSLINLLTDDNFKKIINSKIEESKRRINRFKGLYEIYESKGGAENKKEENSDKKDKNSDKKEKNGDKEENSDKKDKNSDKEEENSDNEENSDEEESNKKEIIKKYIDNSNTSSNNSSIKDKEAEYDKLLNLIFKIEDIKERSYYIYELIERDGLLIDNSIYSKTYGKLIVCGHWKYINKLSKTQDADERSIILNDLYGLYSDNGEETQNIHTCKVCSKVLGTIDFDEFAGGTDEAGKLVESRAIWTDDMDKYIYERSNKKYKIDCTSKVFKEKLGLKGITSLQNVNKSVEICKYISDITNNIGVELNEEDILNINIDCLGKIMDLMSKDNYNLVEIKKLKEKGWDTERIRKILGDKEKLHKSYTKYVIVNKLSIIAARILITLQSAIPEYKITNPTSACAYNGIEDEKGFEYMSCILIAMKLFVEYFHKKNKEETTTYIKSTIEKKYQGFKNDKNIRKMLYRKQDYLDKIKDKVKQKKSVDSYEIDESITIPDNFPEAMKKQEKIIGDYKVVAVNTGKEITKLVSEYMSKRTPIESGLTETSCCYMKKGNNFYTDIKQHFTNIEKLISKAHEIYYNQYLILVNGFYSRVNNKITFRYSGPPTFTYKIEEDDNDIIQDKFLYYCYEGKSIGEEHNYIGFGKMKKCTKCNMTYKDIVNKTYSYKDFEKLNENIGLKTIKEYKKGEILENNDVINDYSDNAINNINALFKILDKYNHKKDIINVEYLVNLGNYNIIFDKKTIKNDKERILNEERRNAKRIELLKKYINQYFRKYVSMCKNNQFVPLSHNIYEDDNYEKIYDKMDDILDILQNDNKQLVDYGVKYNDLFKELTFNTTSDEVRNICYKPNKYDDKYETIIEESKYTADDAINTLLNILTTNLLDFYKIAKGDAKGDTTSNLKEIDERKRIISLFILDVFDEINKETDIINTTQKDESLDTSNNSSTTTSDSDIPEIFGEYIEEDKPDDNVEEQYEVTIPPPKEMTDDSLDSGYDYGDMPQGTEDE